MSVAVVMLLFLIICLYVQPGLNVSVRSGDLGCLPCDCDPVGSISPACSENGQCSCRANVTGPRCDRCVAGMAGMDSHGCRGGHTHAHTHTHSHTLTNAILLMDMYTVISTL